jgi:hypothetical protein
MWAAAAACAAAVVLFALPTPRAVAQRIWDSLFLGRVEVVRLDFDKLPADLLRSERVGPAAAPIAVPDAHEAARVAGFSPRLPNAGVLRDLPRLSVAGPIRAHQTVSVPVLKAALRTAGAGDIDVPQQWDGATLAVRVSPIVIAEYPEVSLTQCLPIALDLPAGFEISRFLEAVFRVAGLKAREARYLSEKFSALPAWFLGLPQDETVEIHEIQLMSGPGMLIEDFDDAGQRERVAIVWSAPDRIYAISGKINRELAVVIANAVQ